MINRLVDLSPRQRKVLIHHYGLNQRDIRSIEETAAYFHLSEKFARDIESEAFAILRKER
ncbi:sigma factor-like helix-turn-helix DNA-binding protein [Pseudobutyrivibrio sp. ACV-2]|uniref:sigma factor-like helix-turn-helix DNA-binding protein n=1 Tax=Pseudobutyrivibrio sp. ACV-2 TaxID=1520801 RepID=UPI000B801BDA|nr:sigma factor-like helix-turn-helix DNA-binding protein [Pseudobutyrivibrio sp. ACV-2]